MQNPNPAEKMRGLVFEYAPEGLDDIARLGGTSVGATRFDRDAGEWFDGSHYTTLKPSFQFTNSGFFSIVIEFTPGFEAADNVAHFFLLMALRLLLYKKVPLVVIITVLELSSGHI